jgi:hypothetical protein
MRWQRARGWLLVVGVLVYAYLSFTDWVPIPNAASSAQEEAVPVVARLPEPEAPARAAPALAPLPVDRAQSHVPELPRAQPTAADVHTPTSEHRVKQRYVYRFDPRRNDY